MAAFVDTLYLSDKNVKHPIRLTPDYAAAAGSPPASGGSSDIKAKVTKTNREFGIRPRRVILSRTVGTGDSSFRKYAKLPVLTLTTFNSDAYALGASIDIGGTTYDVVSRQSEDF